MVFGVATVVGITTAVVTRATAAGAVAAAAAAPQQQAPSAAAGGEPSLWAHLAKFDSTYDCSGKNNTKASGCAPMRPQKTLLECQEYCAQTLTPAGTNCTVFAFQTSATPDKHGLRGCWFRWGSNYTWKDPRDCPPPLRKGCHPSGDTSGCLVGKVKGCTATGSVLRSDGGGDTSQQPPLAALPPMGWSSWNALRCGVSEKQIRATAAGLVASGLRDVGYRYINIDDCWTAKNRSSNGTISADPVKFPNGMQSLARYIHSLQLRLGIYTDVGARTCGGYVGSWRHECQDAATFSAWGIDYIKEDHCDAQQGKAGLDAFYYSTLSKMSACIKAQTRPMFFDICAHACYDDHAFDNAKHNASCWRKWYNFAASHSQSWRSTTDMSGSTDPEKLWRSVLNNWYRNYEFHNGSLELAQFAKPGAWNDPDSLVVGKPWRLSLSQQRLHFSMWCMMAAPLLLGTTELRDQPMSTQTHSILTNRVLLAIDQDRLGIQGSRVHVGGARFDFADVYGDPLSRWEHECWAKPLWNRSIAVALVNHGSTQATLTADLAAVAAKYPAALDWSSGGQLRGREAWTGAAVRAAANGGSFSLPVDSDGVAVIVMRAK